MSETSPPDKAGGARRRGKFLGLRTSYWWALTFTSLIAGWLLSGDIIIGGQSDSQAAVGEGKEISAERSADSTKTSDTPLFRVRTRTMSAKPRDAMLVIRGRTEADAKVQIKAETPGIVEALPVNKGDSVKKGALLCRIEEGARQAKVLEAKALLAQAEADYDAQTGLASRGHTAQLKVIEYQAKLDTAKAGLKTAELDLERTRLNAPFAGIVEDQPAEIGDYLSVGGTCASLVSVDPMLVVGSISERDIGKVRTGLTAFARLVTGEKVEGSIQFISPSSDPRTRTFRIELEVPNSKGQIRDGITADIHISLQTPAAHLLPPAILTLNDAGEIGVRAVETGDIVRFRPVTILSDGKEGVWVAGLPEKVRIITVGQDYVTDGQKVIAVGIAAE